MESDAPCNLDMLPLNRVVAHDAGVLHVSQVVLLAVHLVIQHVVVALDGVLTNTTN